MAACRGSPTTNATAWIWKPRRFAVSLRFVMGSLQFASTLWSHVTVAVAVCHRLARPPVTRRHRGGEIAGSPHLAHRITVGIAAPTIVWHPAMTVRGLTALARDGLWRSTPRYSREGPSRRQRDRGS